MQPLRCVTPSETENTERHIPETKNKKKTQTKCRVNERIRFKNKWNVRETRSTRSRPAAACYNFFLLLPFYARLILVVCVYLYRYRVVERIVQHNNWRYNWGPHSYTCSKAAAVGSRHVFVWLCCVIHYIYIYFCFILSIIYLSDQRQMKLVYYIFHEHLW